MRLAPATALPTLDAAHESLNLMRKDTAEAPDRAVQKAVATRMEESLVIRMEACATTSSKLHRRRYAICAQIGRAPIHSAIRA